MIATIAPVIGSVVLWAVTRSPYVLVFALLGPLVAVASIGDAAIQGRRRSRREMRRFAADLEAARATILREHENEIAVIARGHGNLRALEARSHRDPERWRWQADSELPVVVGVGRLRSALTIGGGEPSARTAAADTGGELELVRAEAAVLAGAPVVVDARLGIGVCGPPALASAAARGIVLQLANALSPATHEMVVSGRWEHGWLSSLPHGIVESDSHAAVVEFRRKSVAGRRGNGANGVVAADAAGSSAADAVVVAMAHTVDVLPPECRTVLDLLSASIARVLPQPHDAVDDAVSPEFASREQAHAFAALLGTAAEAAGLTAGAGGLPEKVAFEALLPSLEADADGGIRRRDSLSCQPALGVAGPMTLDLVGDGPHAVVGGTTGSGKSELLVAWVLAMAVRYSPDVVTFLLVDFKGGSSFTAVQQLPHSVGLVTDLDDRSARRALASLRAELRYRERALADAGVRSIEQLPERHPLARLVIVVDEFAAMMQDLPELHELFADVAARGRSLGVHLILCTQRPAGVVRDAILANCTLRISLRVNNGADSVAVIGSTAAAELPRLPAGRALVCVSGEEPQLAQVAIAGVEDSVTVMRRWGAPGDSGSDDDYREPRRPWCDPLPARIPLDDLLDRRPGAGEEQRGRGGQQKAVLSGTGNRHDDDGLVFGLLDLPSQQRQCTARYLPQHQGSLMVIGGHRSGKSGMLAALLAADRGELVELVPNDHERAWDAVTAQLEAVRAGGSRPRLLLLDDLDVLLGGYQEEYAHAFAETVVALLREGGQAGTQLVITARRLGSGLQQIASLCDSRLVLGLPNRQEHVLAGGDGQDFDPELQPGGGYWHGDRVQLGLASDIRTVPVVRATEQLEWRQWHSWIVVSARPGELVRRLTADLAAAGGRPALPEGWTAVELEARSVAGTAELSVGTAVRNGVVVADAETWQSRWGLVGALATTMPVLFDGCGAAEFRALDRSRRLPPPISPSSGAAWLLTPDGDIRRVLPPWRVERQGTSQ